MNLKGIAAALALFAVVESAHANVNYRQPDWVRPTTPAQAAASRTTYQHWDAFTSTTSNSPDVATVNPNGTPNAFDANSPGSGAIVTGTGNLYAGSGIIRMNTVIPSYNEAGALGVRVLLQITTTANALFDTDGLWTAATPDNPTENDFSRLLVNGQRVDSLPSFEYERRYFVRGSSATSFTFERAIEFELPADAASHVIEWTAARGSTSMAEIAVDTLAVVPEPASLGLLVGAAGVVALRRPRRA